MRILILDNNSSRRASLTKLAKEHNTLEVSAVAAISRESFEAGKFDIALVHYNNPEGRFFEEGWALGGTSLVLFSGGWTSVQEIDGVLYVPEQALLADFRLAMRKRDHFA